MEEDFRLGRRCLADPNQVPTGSSPNIASFPVVMNNQEMNEAKEIWRSAQAVCFDVDSTVILLEGIDELAKFCGKGEAVAQL